MAEHVKIAGGDAALQAEIDAQLAASFAEADADKDGLLNRDEFKNHHAINQEWRKARYGAEYPDPDS